MRELMRRATVAFHAGDYDEAEHLLLEIVERTPLYANIYNMLGFIYSQRNSPEKAVELFRRALSLNPNYTEAQLNLAITLADMGAYELAFLEYGKAERRERGKKVASPLPSVARATLANKHSDLGHMYHEVGAYEEALREYEKALKLCPEFADIHNRMGITLREAGAYEEAARRFIHAIELNPNYVEAHANLGLLYFKMGDVARAIRTLERAHELDPSDSLTQLYLRMAREKTDGSPLGEGGDRPRDGISTP